MSNEKYIPLTETELNEQWDKQKKIINGFIHANGYDDYKDFFSFDSDAICTVISKVHQRKSYFSYFHELKMSEYKEAALVCFWYIKLKPISVNLRVPNVQDREKFAYINERLALFYIFTTLRAALNTHNLKTDMLDNLSQKYLKELLYTFTFRDISKEAMILLVESMAVFLGLDPYA